MARRDADPYGGFNFRLVLGNVETAGFSECTGLAAETKVLEYVEGGRHETTLKFPEVTSFGNVTLKRGVTRSNELLAWQTEIARGSFGRFSSGQPRGEARDSVAIVLMDETGKSVVRRWSLVRPFPVKWLGPDLKAAASEVAIETLELAHEGIVEGTEAGVNG